MKKSVLFIIALIAMTTSCEPVNYDTFSGITGTVVDLDSGDPIPQATVTLSPSGYNTYTGSDGYFEFLDLDARQYTVTVSKTGYIPNRKTITTVAGRVEDIRLTLQKRN